jgi:hypothetical protein
VTRREIRERVEESLQDIDNRRWTNAEINRYIDDAQREFVRISRQPQVTATVALAASGAATAVAGTTTVDSKTVTVTTSSNHGLTTGDVVVVDNEAHIITKVSETIFRYIEDGTPVAGSIQYISYNPNYTVPDTIEEIVSATLDGLNVSIMSEGELDAAVFRFTSGGAFMDSVFGVVPNPFATIRSNYTANATPKWRERNGNPEAIVFNNASSRNFRIFPLPAQDMELFQDPNASSKLFKDFILRGLPRIADTTADTTVPVIGHFYHEALVFGALERAYNREGQTRNTEKGQVYRARFMEMALEAKLNEGINSFSRSEGRNESYFRVVR